MPRQRTRPERPPGFERSQSWEVESFEGDVVIEILANPGSRQILLRFFPRLFEGNVPGFEHQWRMTLYQAEKLRHYLRVGVQPALDSAPNAYSIYNTGEYSQNLIFWNEADLNRFIAAFDDAITYTKADPYLF